MHRPHCPSPGSTLRRVLFGSLIVVALGLTGTASAWAQAPAPAAAGAPAAPNAAADKRCPPTADAPNAEQLRAAQRDAKDRGLLWRATKDGRTAYLYGTLHVGKPTWLMPGPKLREAITAADTLALELDMGHPVVQREVVRASQRPGPKLPPELATKLAARLDAVCLQGTVVERMHPILQVTTLALVAARWEGLDSAYGSEMVLSGMARGAGKRVVSLENVQRQFDALIPPGDDEQQLALVRAALDQVEQPAAAASLRRLVTAWEQGRLDEFESYASWCGCAQTQAERTLFKRVNDDRNDAIADGIAALHARGAVVLAAVGALHMSGSRALPALMAQRGFTVERVAFDP